MSQDNTERWIRAYEDREALWLHDGNPKRPHALLSKGEHSSGFFNSELVIEDAVLLDAATRALMRLLRNVCPIITVVDRVVGPAMGAITLAHDLARQIGKERVRPCLSSYVEKEGEGEDLIMVFKRRSVRPGENVLLGEDVLSTGGSVDLSARAVEKARGVVMPVVGALVNRSGLTELNGRKIVALIDRPMPKWAAHECPLCKQGSEAIRPKEKGNWARLNAKY